MDQGHERRQHTRLPMAVRVKFRDEEGEQVCFTENVSTGGLFLRTETPPFVGVELQLEISVPNVSELIKIKGEVMWRHDGRGCGVRFIRTTAKIREILKAYVDSMED